MSVSTSSGCWISWAGAMARRTVRAPEGIIQHEIRATVGSFSIEFANSRMAQQKSSVSKKKLSATTSVGAARSIDR